MFFLSCSEIIVVVLESTATELYQILTSICDPKLKLDLATIPDADVGTADPLRHIRDKIKVKNTVWHEIFAGVLFCGLVIFCVLRDLIFAIWKD